MLKYDHSPPLTSTHLHSPPFISIHLHSPQFTSTHLHSPPLTSIHLNSSPFTSNRFHLPLFNCTQLHSPPLNSTHLHSPALTCIHLHSPPFTSLHPHSPPLNSTHLHSPPLTCTQLHSPQFIPIHLHSTPIAFIYLYSTALNSIQLHSPPLTSNHLHPAPRLVLSAAHVPTPPYIFTFYYTNSRCRPTAPLPSAVQLEARDHQTMHLTERRPVVFSNIKRSWLFDSADTTTFIVNKLPLLRTNRGNTQRFAVHKISLFTTTTVPRIDWVKKKANLVSETSKFIAGYEANLPQFSPPTAPRFFVPESVTTLSPGAYLGLGRLGSCLGR